MCESERLKYEDGDICALSGVKAFRKNAYRQNEGMKKGQQQEGRKKEAKMWKM